MTRAFHAPRADGLDCLLTVLFLIGVYLGISLNLPGNLPLPAAAAGVAGLAMLAKQFPDIRISTMGAVSAVLLLATLSILLAPDTGLLGERFKGLIQFFYSLVIAIGFYLTARKFSPRLLAGVFLLGALSILTIATLETYIPAFRELCDLFRGWAFDFGIYAADVRDLVLYGRVRPKALTSEPSYASFGYLLFTFGWYALSGMRFKIVPYLLLLAGGFLILRGPTLLLGVALAGAHWVLLASRIGGPGTRRLDITRAGAAVGVAVGIAGVAMIAGSEVLSTRLENIASGRDPSFFARIVAPPMVAFRTVVADPITGAGLAGWEYIENTVQDIYMNSPYLAMNFGFENASHSVTNFFWLHWIFFGLFFGILIIVALSWLLATLGVPSIMFCWTVWTILGQSAGGYVTPRTWCIFMFAAVVATLHERAAIVKQLRSPAGAPPPWQGFAPVHQPMRSVR